MTTSRHFATISVVSALLVAVSSCAEPVPGGNGLAADETVAPTGEGEGEPAGEGEGEPVGEGEGEGEAVGEGEGEPVGEGEGEVVAPPDEDVAVIVSHTLPATLECGASATATVVVRNDGTATWGPDFRLGAVDDEDPLNGAGRIYLGDGVTVAPGATHTFAVELTAPSAPGTLTSDWRMVHEAVRWFGDTITQDVVVACVVDPSAFHFEDTLRDGSVGIVQGGTFDAAGWHVVAHDQRITFEQLPDLVSGSIEFTITGMSNDNLVLADNELFAMYEGGYDMVEPIDYSPEFRNNHYKSLVRVYGSDEAGRAGATKLMFGLCDDGYPGYNTDAPCASPNAFFDEPFTDEGADWSGAPERLRIEWGDGHTRYLRNDVVVIDIDWSGAGVPFAPDELHFSLGTARGGVLDSAGLPLGAVYSDLVVDGVLP